MSCLAAQVVQHFKAKAGVGGIYLYPAKARDLGEEYVYTIKSPDKGKSSPKLVVQSGCMTMFGLPGTKQESMPVLFDDLPEDFDAEEIEQEQAKMEDPPADALEELEE